jgi:hypothetical protein
MVDHRYISRLLVALLLVAVSLSCADAKADGVFVRFQLLEPKDTAYFVRLGGFIHKSPWYLPRTTIPEGADKDAGRRLESREFTDWFDLVRHAEGRLHGRLNRAGGVAELPNVTADFVCDASDQRRTVIIQLATAPREDKVVRQWRETFPGSLTSFLVSPQLAKDAASLETAAEMTERRLRWAREAAQQRRLAPKQLIVQTSFWSPQRPELNLKEAEVLHLLGFNVVGNQRPEVIERFDFRRPGHTHQVKFGPAATRAEIDELMKKHAQRYNEPFDEGVPFGFADEICARPPIGENERALAHFRAWLGQQRIPPRDLGVRQWTDVVPIETPEVLREREKANGPAARRVFYYTSRFRQHAATERIRWHTEAFHRHFPKGAVTSTLVADHPYFSGTGLGMGMSPNPAWSGYPLACDWFGVAHRRAVDLAGIEDWMGLQYMYGPNWTWEGFQLMGFQASIFRSGSRGQIPMIAWITPSDETNLRLKTASALCQGAKNFFYWTYGPTCTSTENYWSDLRGAYRGIVRVTQQLAASEHVIAPGRPRSSRLALLYSISSDLWQPFGYVHMLERRGTYLSLVHDQYLVDMLTEEDIEAGRLDKYAVLYATDPCITSKAAARIVDWVRDGGYVYGTTAAGSRNEFNEPSTGLSEAFGIEPALSTETQPGRYHVRGALNSMTYLDQIELQDDTSGGLAKLGVLGIQTTFKPTTAEVTGTYADGSPAVVQNSFGRGHTRFVGTCPALAYMKEANFVPAELKEKWPAAHRHFINQGIGRYTGPLARLSHAVVEAGIYDSSDGSALVLANFTYEPIDELAVVLNVSRLPTAVVSTERGSLEFTAAAMHNAKIPFRVEFKLPLKLTDIVVME